MSEKYYTPESDSVDSAKEIKTQSKTEIVELSSEKIKEIMSKVKNICEQGTAYTILGRNHATSMDIDTVNRLSNTLGDGLLNINWLKTRLKDKTSANIKRVQSNKLPDTTNTKGQVYFNIIGESRKSNGEDATFFDDDYFPGSSVDGYNLALIFDLSKYKSEKQKTVENMTEDGKVWSKPEKSRSYTYNGPFSLIRSYSNKNPDELPKAYDAYGYALSHRVPSRFFEGMVIHPERLSVDKILYIVLDKFKESGLYLPIYDESGNLLWPQEMSHEEIVKMKDKSE